MRRTHIELKQLKGDDRLVSLWSPYTAGEHHMAQVLCVSHHIDQVQEGRCYFNAFITQVTDGRVIEDIRQLLLPLATSVCTTLWTFGYLVRADFTALKGISCTKCFKWRHTHKLHTANNIWQGRDSSVDIATRYGLEGACIESR